MKLSVDKTGFVINGKRYNIGDILCYPNPNIKGIVLFGFYDNGLSYEDEDYGCGFYIMNCNLVNGKWTKDNSSIESISTYLNEEKETNENIIKEVKSLFEI